MKYLVQREHYGDKDYKTGDIREADPSTVKHLVDKEILAEYQEPEDKATKPKRQVKTQ
ncbi:hypothetical protein [Acinetobacter soli]|uniref:hypothetical protein n=1 Tax=Acinetobacter soli TaxID=487316 RepID=UPI00148F1D7F|nr:hypothetical protein [Acinetobacter soli]